MANDEEILKAVRAAFESEPRIELHRGTVHLAVMDGTLTLEGDVASLAARRLALRLAREIDGVGEVVDCLRVAAPVARGDGEISASLAHALLTECDFKNCTVRRHESGRIETLHQALGDDRSGEITFAVGDGVVTLEGDVISLTHRRLAEVLAWWATGTRQVANRLQVVPPEEDHDGEITDAVRLALELDPLVHADQVRVATTLGVVSLDGVVTQRGESQRAEHDAWCVAGVNEVVNRLVAEA
jgi:osmotically-inducible protein OsmY